MLQRMSHKAAIINRFNRLLQSMRFLYLKGIGYHGLRYVRDGELMLHHFVDTYWVGDAGGRKNSSKNPLIHQLKLTH
jgi:hypothetical protein